jgi:hypothetical protein
MSLVDSRIEDRDHSTATREPSVPGGVALNKGNALGEHRATQRVDPLRGWRARAACSTRASRARNGRVSYRWRTRWLAPVNAVSTLCWAAAIPSRCAVMVALSARRPSPVSWERSDTR